MSYSKRLWIGVTEGMAGIAKNLGISRWIFKNDLPYSHHETNSSYAPSTHHDEGSVYQDMFEGEVEREREDSNSAMVYE